MVISKEDFLRINNISEEYWERSGACWENLQAIKHDYLAAIESLKEFAAMYARVIQQYDHVHSVRWRVKDVDHLLLKIIRKSHEGAEKYKNICVENYRSVLTDLVGIRALHLYKEDFLKIDSQIRKNHNLAPDEKPIIYIRKGDEFLEKGIGGELFEIKEHDAGYRSIHYILKSQPQKDVIFSEIQVRTIFEEGWSEIDHNLRYPAYTVDSTVELFLVIFNRLAGQADEMGSFVRNLANVTAENARQLSLAIEERESYNAKIKLLIDEVEEKTKQHAEAQGSVKKLKAELNRMVRADEIKDIADKAALNIYGSSVGSAIDHYNKNMKLGIMGVIGGSMSISDEIAYQNEKTRKMLLGLGIEPKKT